MSTQPTCQEPGCEVVLPTGGRGRPRKFCADHSQRAKQLQRKAARPACCHNGTCEQHQTYQRMNRDGKAKRYNSSAAGSKNFRGRKVVSNGHALPETRAVLISKWRPGTRPGLHAKMRREGYSNDDIRTVMAVMDAWTELQAERLRWMLTEPDGE